MDFLNFCYSQHYGGSWHRDRKFAEFPAKSHFEAAPYYILFFFFSKIQPHSWNLAFSV